MFPFDLPSQCLQPLVLLADGFYAPSREGAGDAELELARGRAHPLRLLCGSQVLSDRLGQSGTREAERLLREVLPRLRAAAAGTDALSYFVQYLAPAVRARDRGEEPGGPERPAAPEPADLATAASAACRGAPPPVLPSPSLWILGRVWRLRPTTEEKSGPRVRRGTSIFALSGECSSVRSLAAAWQNALGRFVEAAASALLERARRAGETDELRRVREELRRGGYLQEGDLLYFPGPPPLVGHLLPAHYNQTLQRESRGDIALVAPLELPPRLVSRRVLVRTAAGWQPFDPPHGICLGGEPPGEPPESAGLALVGHLRWAAVRFAANGKFHASDT
jgi:hypothetical protein